MIRWAEGVVVEERVVTGGRISAESFLEREQRESAKGTPEKMVVGPALPPSVLEARRNLHFFIRTSHIFLSYKAFQAQSGIYARITGAGSDTVDSWWSRQHDWGGRQLYSMACDMKGFHLKGAQWLGTRPDIAPKEWVTHLSKLQDRCPEMPLSQVCSIVEAELGGDMDSLFASFDAKPIGSASIAQVHRARLRCGGWLRWARASRPVAIKVQRPGTEARMLGDLKDLRAFFSVGFVRKGLAWEPSVILDQVEEETRMEFDFEFEARTMDSARRVVQGGGLRIRAPPVAIPRSVSGMVTPRVLTMELLPGEPLSRLEAASDLSDKQRARVGRSMLGALGATFGRMLFDDGLGLVHADPHPGNILLAPRRLPRPSLNVGLIDWGQSRVYDLPTRLRLAALVEALCAAGDADGRATSPKILRCFEDLGVTWKSELPIEAQRAAIAASATEMFDTVPIPPPFSGDPTSPNYALAALELTAFPTDLVYFFRATQILRALTEHTGADWSLAHEWRPHARRLLRRKGRNPKNWVMTETTTVLPGKSR